jgi:hypothetical protein
MTDDAAKKFIETIEWLNDQLQSAVKHEAALAAALWDHPAPACAPTCKSALAIMKLTKDISPVADALLAIVVEAEKLDDVHDGRLSNLRAVISCFNAKMRQLKGQ